MKLTTIALPLFLAHQALAICPGFNYAIGNVRRLGSGFNQWIVYDDSCRRVDGLITAGNPCNQHIFGCSPPPIIFERYTNSLSGLIYACRRDPNSGICGNDIISVCCRNDGR